MSRTFRWIPYWCRYFTNWDRTQAGIYPENAEWCLKWDDRNWLYNGYDSHKARSCVYGIDGWKEEYNGESRRFAKRYYHKNKRRKAKIEIRKEINEDRLGD